MRKSVLEPANAIKSKLLEVPDIVTKFSSKHNEALPLYLNWLEASEELLKQYNRAESAELAGIRASILASGRGTDGNRSLNKKKTLHAAMSQIQSAQGVLSDIHRNMEDKIENVRELVKQILVPAKDAGLITIDPSQDFTAFLEGLLQQFKAHPQLSSGINSAIASVGKYDVIRVLAEEIDLS